MNFPYNMENLERKPKKKPTKIEELTKEQIRQAIIKKRECNAKAQQIVESLLEKEITEAYFMQCLSDINQSHFEDVIEERAIIHICGYPLCQNTLSVKDIPKQKYRISLKTNKVYDITDRKNFCSNSCYKSATHIKKQLLTSPLWFREYEEIPKFYLLPLDKTGTLGQEVDVALVEKIKVEKPQFSSINDFATASLKEMTNTQVGQENNKCENENNKYCTESNEVACDSNINNNTDKVESIIKNTVNHNSQHENVLTQEEHNTSSKEGSNKEATKKPIKKHSNPFNIVGEILEKPEKEIDPILTQIPDVIPAPSVTQNKKHHKNMQQKKQPAVTVLTIQVEKCLAEWFTLDTMLLLFGEEKVKEIVKDKGECIKEYLNNYSSSIAYNSNTYDQYQALCRKLNMLELEDRKFDAQTLQRETKPLPDYSILQKESKKIQLKVKAFFAGEMEIPDVAETVDNPSPIDNNENFTQLPLIDKNAQNALRRRIVCEHLNKALPDLLQSLGMSSLSISADVRLLVNTFKLKANNIMFKPIQWTLIVIIVIKLLSLRDRRLAYLLEQPTAYQHLQLLLLSFKQDGGYLDRLISWLTDIDRLLDTNDIQLTIE
ncbi:putative RNA polymerase II subunit B1 CTD phosphatase RPAP2 [Galleria mellonella]|uniref:RNA polymerase II subunit B1 CTD phosphatase RPAP2 homolog n=1 Tax=Galleria mellonella TaxID=7137 RepID=A0A6J1X8X0_GALME|nr:putative RNA polymerase II subunit B1 CTD phosphatase RPAP2 [Galleria mellonella]